MKKIPTEDNPIPYKFPLRVGRKKGIAILDADSCEVVIFPIGSEEMAKQTCELWNEWYNSLTEHWNEIDPDGLFRKNWI